MAPNVLYTLRSRILRFYPASGWRIASLPLACNEVALQAIGVLRCIPPDLAKPQDVTARKV